MGYTSAHKTHLPVTWTFIRVRAGDGRDTSSVLAGCFLRPSVFCRGAVSSHVRSLVSVLFECCVLRRHSISHRRACSDHDPLE
jgi:hypothetical protein